MSRLKHFIYNDQSIDVVYLRRKRKTLTIHVSAAPKAIEVRMPLNCAWTDVDRFVQMKQDWIAASLGKLFEQQSQLPQPTLYLDGERVLFLGKFYQLRTYAGRSKVYLAGSYLMVRCMAPTDAETVKRLVHNFYRVMSLPVFEKRLDLNVSRFPVAVEPGSLQVRKMTARWGSCSRTGEICLNTLLIKYDEALIDFVLTHELCHLVHFNHSPAFYGLMDQVMPDWKHLEGRMNAS